MTTCQCGEPFTATTDGRQRHRLIFEHTPVAELPIVAAETGVSGWCHRHRHNDCGGGWLHMHRLTACACGCHEDGAA